MVLPAAGGNAQIREMRATTGALWFIAQTRDGFAIISTDLTGRLKVNVALPIGSRAAGLAVTSRGIATIIQKGRQGILTEFDEKGSQTSQVNVSCYTSESLLTINGNPATVCPDGTINEFSPGRAPLRRSSWARPGALVESLSTKQLAIVDQATGQAVLNDLDHARILTVSTSIPEIDEALQYTRAAAQQFTKSQPIEAPPLGRQLIVMSTAHDNVAWYELVWPYNRRVGPSVVKISNTGQLLKRIRCRVPNATGSLHKIDVGSGYLILGSVAGEVFLFKL